MTSLVGRKILDRLASIVCWMATRSPGIPNAPIPSVVNTTTIHNAKTGSVVKELQTGRALASTGGTPEGSAVSPLLRWGIAATALVAEVRVAGGAATGIGMALRYPPSLD